MNKFLLIIFLIIFVQICRAMEPEKKYTIKEIKEDLDYLLKKLENIHPNPYIYTSRAIICEKRKNIENSITQVISKIEFWRKIAPFLSSLQCNHIYSYSLNSEINKYNNLGNKFFPFNVIILNNELHLIENDVYNYERVSGKILSINSQSYKIIIKKMSNIIGDKRNTKNLISEAFTYYLWLVCGISNDFKIEYISNKDNKKYFFTNTGVLLEKLNKKQSKIFDYYTIKNIKVGVLQIKTFLHEKKEIFKAFLFDKFKEIKEKGAKDLIIDIRKNTGGSDYNGRLLFNYITDKPYLEIERGEQKVSKVYKELYKRAFNINWYNILLYPDYIKMLFVKDGAIIRENNKLVKPANNEFLFKGNLYLLTSSQTSSAAMDFAAAFKYYKMGTIIGEETGGSLIEYSNGIPFTLPNTKLEGIIASQKSICVGAKDDGHGVIPDYEVIPSIDDVYNGTDRVMEFTKEFIEKRRKSNNN